MASVGCVENEEEFDKMDWERLIKNFHESIKEAKFELELSVPLKPGTMDFLCILFVCRIVPQSICFMG